MSKEQVYKQIDIFIQNKKDTKETKSNKFYYIETEEAQNKANFIRELLRSDKALEKKFKNIKNILDLAYGSGNLLSHIILENNINYKELILNDYFLEDTNKSLESLLENTTLVNCNFFDETCFKEKSVDLLVFNPTHGGKPAEKDYFHKNNKDFKALNKTISKVLSDNGLVIFRGSETDFKEFNFSNFKYQYIYLDGDSSLFLAYDINIEKRECYEFKNNKYELNKDCKKINIQKDEDLEINKYLKELDDLSRKEDNGIVEYTIEEKTKMKKENFTNKPLGSLVFPHKNLLLKGVPGTGKSKTIDNIIENDLDMNGIRDNVLRINIHSASSNSDLMQGISISTDDKSNILYREKRGAVLKHIFKAMFKPNQPFVLVLEEIQENSLNELIGDLIYLIEKDKRTEIKLEDDQELSYTELFEKVNPKHFVELPNLVEGSESNIKMIMPDNLYVFCTSNYRDDKKVIEDNLLRRFDVVEIYPQTQEVLGESIFKSKEVSDFLSGLNNEILKKFEDETHPDRYLVGHANWLDITEEDNDENKKLFYTALLKVLIEFKEIREVDFEAYAKEIVESVCTDDTLAKRLKSYINACDLEYKSYKEMVEKLQKEIYSFLK